MSLRFIKDDYIQTFKETVLFSANSAKQPAENVKSKWPSKQWRTSSDAAGRIIAIKLPLTCACNCAAIVSHALQSSSAGASASIWHAITATFIGETRLAEFPLVASAPALVCFFTSTSARYWRIKLTDNTTTGDQRIGVVALGAYWQPSSAIVVGHTYEPVDDSKTQETDGGQLHVDERTAYSKHDLSLEYIDETELSQLQTFCRDSKKSPRVTVLFHDEVGGYRGQFVAVYGSVEMSNVKRRGATWTGATLKIRQWV